MPKKTRKKKIAAQIRKEQRILAPNTSISTEEKTPQRTFTTVSKRENSDEERQLSTYFIGDLKRSMLLIAIVIALEIVIYFGTINN